MDWKTKIVEEFNNKYDVGDKVKLKKDDGSIEDVTVKYPAALLSGIVPVCWFKEIRGCYDLERVVT